MNEIMTAAAGPPGMLGMPLRQKEWPRWTPQQMQLKHKQSSCLVSWEDQCHFSCWPHPSMTNLMHSINLCAHFHRCLYSILSRCSSKPLPFCGCMLKPDIDFNRLFWRLGSWLHGTIFPENLKFLFPEILAVFCVVIFGLLSWFAIRRRKRHRFQSRDIQNCRPLLPQIKQCEIWIRL